MYGTPAFTPIIISLGKKSNKIITIQEIFESPAVKCVEIEILDMMTEYERSWRTPQGKVAIQHLLSVRKNIPKKMFVMTDEYKSLLEKFNEKLIEALSEMRWQTINMHDISIKSSNPNTEI